MTGTALLCPAPAPLTAHGHRMHSHPPQPDLAFQVCFIGTHGSVSRAHRKWDGRLCSCRAEPQSHLCREVPPCSPPGPTHQPGAQSLWSPHLAASLCPSVPSHSLSHASQLLLHITVPTSLTIPVTRTLGHCLVSPEEQLRIGPSAGLRVSTLWPCLLEQPPMPGTLLVRGSEPCDKGQAHGL